MNASIANSSYHCHHHHPTFPSRGINFSLTFFLYFSTGIHISRWRLQRRRQHCSLIFTISPSKHNNKLSKKWEKKRERRKRKKCNVRSRETDCDWVFFSCSSAATQYMQHYHHHDLCMVWVCDFSLFYINHSHFFPGSSKSSSSIIIIVIKRRTSGRRTLSTYFSALAHSF